MAKSEKKLLKYKNLSNFKTQKDKPNFLILKVKTFFNHLWLTFIKTPIFWYFDLKYNIKIEIDISGYIINNILY